ncbi:MAG: DUF4019 domain-containing protein, partial [Candidatus Binataceae bacterium]
LAMYASARADEAAAKAAAENAAMTWLHLIDDGKYSQSWSSSSSYFRGAVNQLRWEQALQGVRKPLGPVLLRNRASANYTKSFPGAPDGEYVVIQYATSFDKKRTSIETVTPMLDTDGSWRVGGYFIH